jgi:hypothetical protein
MKESNSEAASNGGLASESEMSMVSLGIRYSLIGLV